jgi:SSS family solute:Na+ symporter
MSIVFVVLIALMVLISLTSRREASPPVISIDKTMFRTSPSFVAGSVLIIGILTALYTVFW